MLNHNMMNNEDYSMTMLLVTMWIQCVERLDLVGMDFIWRIAMETPDEEIANEAIQLIITYSYTNLNPKMKKVSVIHLWRWAGGGGLELCVQPSICGS